MKKTKIIPKKIRVLYSRIVTTADIHTEADAMTNSGVIDAKKINTIKPIQRVISVGTGVRFLNVGDMVSLTFARYGVKTIDRATNYTGDLKNEKYKDVTGYRIPLINIDGKDYLFIDEGDVEYVIDEYETQDIEVNLTSLVGVTGNKILSA